MKTQVRLFILIFAISLPLTSFTQPKHFLPTGTYNAAIPTPKSILGFEPGDRPARHHEVIQYFQKLSEVSPRAQYFESGETHEKRLLGYLVISSEENMGKLDAIKKQLSTVADPRKNSSINLENTVGAAWMMYYSIHGDELSGTDASVQLAYQLTAGTDDQTTKILNKLVVGIDPMENPDGRERYLAQMQQWGNDIQNSDVQAITHTGVWPYGRGNHYLFDLNRDWFILAHPESRARMKALNEWNPQLVVDAHEMGANSTFLFNPPREPINFNVTKSARQWWQIFAQHQAEAFDDFGWSYYTRAWYDDLYPGYGSAMPNYWGAVGILYEQASTDGSLVKKLGDKMSTFKDAVHRQFISSMSNLTTTAENRTALLRDFQSVRKNAAATKGAFYIPVKDNPSRAERLVERLLLAGIEVYKVEKPVTLRNGTGHDKKFYKTLSIPADVFIVPLAQPLSHLVQGILEFDPRMLNKVLQKEFTDLQKGKGTHLYEVTAWSMLLAYDVNAYYSDIANLKNATLVEKIEPRKGVLNNAKGAAVFVCDYNDDNAIPALLAMYKNGLKVRSAQKPFEADGRKYKRGTLLLRANENDANLALVLKEISKTHHVDIHGVKSMRIQDGPDLGGDEFVLLESPRIGLLTGPDLSGYNVGTTWYMLDHELNTRFSMLNHNFFSRYDLRKYNVIILPDTWGNLKTYHNVLGKAGKAKLKDWVKDGGTLIGMKGGAAFLADSSSGISKVRLKRQALKELELYKEALAKEELATRQIDSLSVWEGKTAAAKKPSAAEKLELEKLKAIDERGRLFQPRGAIFNTALDQEHWLNFGAGNSVPAIIYSSYAFLSKKPVQTPARFNEGEKLRLAGLLWPEAKERWAKTAYATREASGKGQIILFAGEPNFRSYFYGTTRLLLNAMLLGPGMGTNVGVDW